MKEEKKHLSVMIDKRVYTMLKVLVLKKHRRIKGALSQEVEDALRDWINKHLGYFTDEVVEG